MPNLTEEIEEKPIHPENDVHPDDETSILPLEEDEDNEDDSGPSTYTFERILGESELQAIEEYDEEQEDADDVEGAQGQEAPQDESATIGDAVVEFEDGSVVSLTREEIDRIVAANLKHIDEDYSATERAGKKSEVIDDFVVKSPILAAALAKRPDLQEKIRALKAMKQQMMTGQSFVQSEVVDDFPEDYDALQLQDSEAIQRANQTASQPFSFPDNVVDPFDDWSDFRSGDSIADTSTANAVAQRASADPDLGFSSEADINFGAAADNTTTPTAQHNSAIDDFDPFPVQPPAPDDASDAAPNKLKVAVAPALPKAQKVPSVRAVSPLKTEVRESISDIMSRIHLNVRNISPWTDRLFDVALQTGRQAIDAHKAAQKEAESSQ